MAKVKNPGIPKAAAPRKPRKKAAANPQAAVANNSPNVPFPRVTIFGAGIAGLTAAHELVERGFFVQVVDPAESLFEEGYCEVGGVAATQWSFLSDPTLPYKDRIDPRSDSMKGMSSQFALGTSPNFESLPEAPSLKYRLYFKGESSSGTWSPGQYDPSYKLGPKMNPPVTDNERIENMPNSERFQLLVASIEAFLRNYGSQHRALVYVVGHTERTPTEYVARAQSLRWARKIESLLTAKFGGRGIVFEAIGVGSADPIGDNAVSDGRLRNNRVELHMAGVYVPGDHGYRFFPSFYRNLDDSMRRTPLYDRDGYETGESAFDRLKSAKTVSIATTDGRKPFMLPRRRTRSFEELRALTKEMFEKLEYTTKDVALFQLQLFRFLTSSPERRTAMLDGLSWLNYIQGKDHAAQEPTENDCPRCGRAMCHDHVLPFSDKFLEDLDKLPQAMAGMRSKESDAHTNGTITLQLLMDQLGEGTNSDRLLDGPTTSSWLLHWKSYLRRQGVRFFVGKLKGFRPDSTTNPRKLKPIAVGTRGGAERPGAVPPIPEPCFADELRTAQRPSTPLPDGYVDQADYYITALPVNLLKGMLNSAFPDRNVILQSPLDTIRNFPLGRAFSEFRDGPPRRDVPFRDISGLQFYFANDFHLAEGHAYHADSGWRLTSVSQLQFWRQRRTTNSGYLGVLSVDIGDMHAGDTSACTETALAFEDVIRSITEALVSNQSSAMKDLLRAAEATSRRAHSLAKRLQSYVARLAQPQDSDPNPVPEVIKVADAARTVLGAGVSQAISDISSRISLAPPPTQRELDQLTRRAERAAAAIGGMQPPPPFQENDKLWVSIVKIVQSMVAVVDSLTAAEVTRQAKFVVATLTKVEQSLNALTRISFAWQSTRDEIAKSVWRQIKLSLHSHVRGAIPDPNYYRIDSGIVFGSTLTPHPPAPEDPRLGLPIANRTPYFINAVKSSDGATNGFAARPGVLPTKDPRNGEFYEIAYGQWLPVGGIMKSHTRITSMEHANESARHAVRAIHHKLATLPAPDGIMRGSMPDYWNPEDHEFEDLQFLRRIDSILYEDKRPHLVDILGLEEAVIRWVAGPGAESPDNVGHLLSAIRHQANDDFAPWIESMEKNSEPFRKIFEFFARMGMQSSVK